MIFQLSLTTSLYTQVYVLHYYQLSYIYIIKALFIHSLEFF